MLPINTNLPVTSSLSNYNVQGTQAQSTKASVSPADLLPILASVGQSDIAVQSFFAGPELTSPATKPSPEVLSELISFLQGKLEDTEFVVDMGKIHSSISSKVNDLVQQKVKEQGGDAAKPIDISGFSSSAVALLVAANALMLSLSQSETQLSSRLSLVSFEATKMTAASLVREGTDMLSGAVSQAALQLGITAVGAKKEHSGIQNERGALKNNAAKMQSLSTEASSIQRSLNAQNHVKLGADQVDGLSKLDLKGPNPRANTAGLSSPDVLDGNISSVDLGASHKSLSAEHKAVLEGRLESINYDRGNEELVFGDNKLKANDKRMVGNAISHSSGVVGGVASSGGQYSATLERSEQQISEASSRLSNSAADESKEASRKSKELLQELLRVMADINSSKNATNSQIAGNIRA